MQRRRFLGAAATLGSVGLAGCGGADYSDWLYVQPATAERVATFRAKVIESEAQRQFLSRLAAAGGVNLSDDQFGDNESIPELPENGLLRTNGSVYNVSLRRLGTVSVRALTVEVERNASSSGEEPDDGDADDSAVVAFDDLPAVDRRRLASVFPTGGESAGTTTAGTTRAGTTTAGTPTVDVGSHQLRYPVAVVNQSRLAVEDSSIRGIHFDGTRYDVEVVSRREEETNLVRLAVADEWSYEDYRARVFEEYGVTLSGLSDAERAALEEAIETGAYEVTGDEGGEALHDRLDEHEPLRSGGPGTDELRTPPFGVPYVTAIWLARYDGSDYLIQHTSKTFD